MPERAQGRWLQVCLPAGIRQRGRGISFLPTEIIQTSGCVRYGYSEMEWSGPALTETSSSSGWGILLPLAVLLL